MALPTPPPTLPSFLEQAIAEHLKGLHRAIVRRAQDLALQDSARLASTDFAEPEGPLEITTTQCLRAIEEIAPARPKKPHPAAAHTSESASFWSRFLDSVSPITLICSILTIAFASFGLLIMRQEGKAETNPMAYLDIAKIFAGAIVGSASVAIVHSARQKPQ